MDARPIPTITLNSKELSKRSALSDCRNKSKKCLRQIKTLNAKKTKVRARKTDKTERWRAVRWRPSGKHAKNHLHNLKLRLWRGVTPLAAMAA